MLDWQIRRLCLMIANDILDKQVTKQRRLPFEWQA